MSRNRAIAAETGSRLIEAQIIPTDALRAEADLYGTMELAQQLQASDVGPELSKRSPRPSNCSAAPTRSYRPPPCATAPKNASPK
ncbi:hypothetical protein ACOZ38_32840 [Sphaerisporangium viridialbum]|uniref:hypothetical protein n=1 Tax=Sphaerisporangium viridialbum TaxID=46189 RepID=UPI003C70DFDF